MITDYERGERNGYKRGYREKCDFCFRKGYNEGFVVGFINGKISVMEEVKKMPLLERIFKIKKIY